MIDFDLVGSLDEGLRASLNTFGTPSAWRFSDFGKCPRCVILKRLGFHSGAKISLKSHFIMEMGHVIEEKALEWLSRSTNVDILAKQVRVQLPQHQAKGTMDALGKLGNSLVPIEVKSTRDKALEYRIPYKNHEMQARGYTWAINLPWAILLYIGRDGTIKQSWVENNQEGRDEIAAELDNLNLFWENMPARGEETDEEYFKRIETHLPPAPTMVLQPVLDTDGNPVEYKRAGPWGPKGTVKTEMKSSGGCVYCSYPGLCCEMPTVPDDVLGGEVDTTTRTDLPQQGQETVSSPSDTTVSPFETSRGRRENPPPNREGKVWVWDETAQDWREVENESWINADTGTPQVPELAGDKR